MAHYINPAFCQKSEFPQKMIISTSIGENDIEIERNHYFQATSLSKWTVQQPIQHSRYALVPLEDLSNADKDRYCILPNGSLRLTKSHDNLDVIPSGLVHEGEEDSFTSLPASTSQKDSKKLISGFSSDFINKSMILIDPNRMQRYTIIPTDDDEDVVDSNHEIIEMHNGRVHRYAVIPTVDEIGTSKDVIKSESTSVKMKSNSSVKNSSTGEPSCFVPIKENNSKSQHLEYKMKSAYGLFDESHPIKTEINNSSYVNNHQQINYDKLNYVVHSTPTKNSIATQKLHKLLSTPRKDKQEILQRHGSYHTIIGRSPDQFQSQKQCYTQEHSKFTPQKLLYEDKNIDHRTAVISPRLHQQVAYNNTRLDVVEKPWIQENILKMESATATIGVISLMLILTGILNSGLCLYMITDMRRSYYLDLCVLSGFASTSLGIMGFRSRHCYWQPNRNFISGYVMVTVFSLLNCCGLLVLLGLNPFPGTPFHDLTTGVILALSSLILLIISLGVITSKLCSNVPTDNRVDVF